MDTGATVWLIMIRLLMVANDIHYTDTEVKEAVWLSHALSLSFFLSSAVFSVLLIAHIHWRWQQLQHR